MDLSIIIVNFHSRDFLAANLESLFGLTKGIELEVIIVDNSQPNEPLEFLQTKFGRIRFIKNTKNVGFGAAVNEGFRVAKGRYLLVLNPDVRFLRNVLAELCAYLDSHPAVDIATIRLTDGTGAFHLSTWRRYSILRLILHTFFNWNPGRGSGYIGFNPSVVRQTEVVTGAFMIMRREVLEQLNGFDEKIFLYGEEADFCLRASEAGLGIYYLPFEGAVHIRYGSSKSKANVFEHNLRSRLYVIKKHYGGVEARLLKAILLYGQIYRAVVFRLLGMLFGRDDWKRMGKEYRTALANFRASQP